MTPKDDSLRDQDAKIRERAHEIWLSEGRPEGRHSEHWEQARAELSAKEPKAEGARKASRSSARSQAAKAADQKPVAEKKSKSAPKPGKAGATASKAGATSKTGGEKRSSKSPAGTE